MPQYGEQTDNHKNKPELIPSGAWGRDVRIAETLIQRNLNDIKEKIAPCKPKIIGVTKYYGVDSVISGYKAGLRAFGESRVLDAIEKMKALPEEVRKNSEFHFIGHLQTNKAEQAVKYFDWIETVDSLKLANVVSSAACRLNKREKVLLQVNNAGEEQKFGYTVAQLKTDFSEIVKLEGIEVLGLMNMATLGASTEKLHKQFSELRELRDELEKDFNFHLSELSMGMSDDYDIAVQEGATIIRIGRKLFTN